MNYQKQLRLIQEQGLKMDSELLKFLNIQSQTPEEQTVKEKQIQFITEQQENNSAQKEAIQVKEREIESEIGQGELVLKKKEDIEDNKEAISHYYSMKNLTLKPELKKKSSFSLKKAASNGSNNMLQRSSEKDGSLISFQQQEKRKSCRMGSMLALQNNPFQGRVNFKQMTDIFTYDTEQTSC